MEELFENWGEAKEALMEGLDAKQSGIVAPLLENQKNYLLSETASSGSTAAHDIAGFRKILLPMIRRIIPGTIATEIIGVQPMQGPVGLVYSLRHRYGDTVDATGATHMGAAGQLINAGDEVFGNDTTGPRIERFYSGGTDTAQAPGAGGFGADGVVGGAGSSAGDAVTVNPITGTVVDADYSSLQAWGSSLDMNDVTVPTPGTVGGSGSFLEGSGGRKLNMEVLSQPVQAGSRKLQASWTIEAMQDLNAQHGIDLENEMTQAMSAEIVQEIDAEILHDLLALAGTVQTFDFNDITNSVPADTPLHPSYIGDKFANLQVTINYVANEIGRKTRRGVGNFIVVSPMIVSLLQSASKSVFAPAVEGSFKGPNNTMLVGTLNGSIKVYSYIWNQTVAPAASDLILVGYKGGNGETDAGYFYCPYIPLMSSGTIVNPVTFQPVVSLMTRYGKTAFTDTATSLGNSADYYGKITVQNVSFT